MRLADPNSDHRPIVLSGGVDVKRLGANHSEMEFIAALQWSVEEVSRAFGVPKVFLSEFEDATLANVRTMEQFLWRNTIIPELKMLEDGINHRLAPHFEALPERIDRAASTSRTSRRSRSRRLTGRSDCRRWSARGS